jgi:hypothetical protein
MKRTAILAIAAAMVIAPSVAAAASSASVRPAPVKPALVKSMPVKPALLRHILLRASSPQKAGRLGSANLSLQVKLDGRSGHTLFRLGDTGLWME